MKVTMSSMDRTHRRWPYPLYKMFPIHENIKLQFRAESFNLLNTPSFSNPATTIRTYTNGIGSSTADAAISSTRPSAIPRQLQFVLRLIF